MPVKIPGRRAGSGIALRQVKRNMQAKASRALSASLNLTSMVDFMSVLTIFLLMNFSASGDFTYNQGDIIPPEAFTGEELKRVPIIAMTNRRSTARVMALTWGCYCVVTGDLERFKQAVVNAARAARASGIASEGDQIVVTAGVPFNVPGTTNILRVAPCDERLIYSTDPE